MDGRSGFLGCALKLKMPRCEGSSFISLISSISLIGIEAIHVVLAWSSLIVQWITFSIFALLIFDQSWEVFENLSLNWKVRYCQSRWVISISSNHGVPIIAS